MAVETGIGGKVTRVSGGAALAELGQWVINSSVATVPRVTSSTEGGTKHTVGATLWGGTMTLHIDSNVELVEGDVLSVRFHKNATGSDYMSGEIVVQSVSTSVIIETATNVNQAVTFVGNGTLSRNGQLAKAP
jgi:hypothetical protein